MNLLKSSAFISTTLLATASATTYGAEKPNVVLIFVDDMGYGDLGCYGHTVHQTPNLNTLAAEGVQFNDFYVACSVCSPSRAALLTGAYPKRINMHCGQNENDKVIRPGSYRGLNTSELNIPTMLKSVGYTTGMFGKWHLGDQPQFMPDKQGFDYYYGLPYSNDMTPSIVFEHDKVVQTPCDQDNITKTLTERASRFIRENKDKPFFVYLPHPMPHVPVHVSADFQARADEIGKYGAAIEELDWSVGQIRQTLEECGVDDNTLIIFSSDNGGTSTSRSNQPLRGSKGQTFDGGIRVPGIMWWKNKISPKVTSEVATSMDILPTLARITGAALSANKIDGHDIYDLMTTADATSPTDFFYYYQLGQLQAVRMGKWKMYIPLETIKTSSAVTAGSGSPVLYNLENDIDETTDVSSANPAIVSTITAKANEIIAELGHVDDGVTTPGTDTRAAGWDANPEKITAKVATPTINVYLIGGESNAEGQGAISGFAENYKTPQEEFMFIEENGEVGTLQSWSPTLGGLELSLTPTLDTLYPVQTNYPGTQGDSIVVIKYAANNTNLQTDWKGDGSSSPSNDGKEYQAFQEHINWGLDHLARTYPDSQINIAGMVWQQGEEDAVLSRTFAQYEADLTTFITDIRATYGSDIPFSIGKLSDNQTSIPQSQRNEITTAQDNVNSNIANSATVNSDGFTVNEDNLNFSSTGLTLLGKAHATELAAEGSINFSNLWYTPPSASEGATTNIIIGGRAEKTGARNYITMFGDAGKQTTTGTITDTLGGENFTATFTLSVSASSGTNPVIAYRGSNSTNNFIGVNTTEDSNVQMHSTSGETVTVAFTSIDNANVKFDGFTMLQTGNAGASERAIINDNPAVSGINNTSTGVDLAAAPYNTPQILKVQAATNTSGGVSTFDIAQIGLKFSITAPPVPEVNITSINLSDGAVTVTWDAIDHANVDNYVVEVTKGDGSTIELPSTRFNYKKVYLSDLDLDLAVDPNLSNKGFDPLFLPITVKAKDSSNVTQSDSSQDNEYTVNGETVPCRAEIVYLGKTGTTHYVMIGDNTINTSDARNCAIRLTAQNTHGYKTADSWIKRVKNESPFTDAIYQLPDTDTDYDADFNVANTVHNAYRDLSWKNGGKSVVSASHDENITLNMLVRDNKQNTTGTQQNSTVGKLWIDWNGDGDFEDQGELIESDYKVGCDLNNNGILDENGTSPEPVDNWLEIYYGTDVAGMGKGTINAATGSNQKLTSADSAVLDNLSLSETGNIKTPVNGACNVSGDWSNSYVYDGYNDVIRLLVNSNDNTIVNAGKNGQPLWIQRQIKVPTTAVTGKIRARMRYAFNTVQNSAAYTKNIGSYKTLASPIYDFEIEITDTPTPAMGLEVTQTGTKLEWTVAEERGVKEYKIIDSQGNTVQVVVANGSKLYSIKLNNDNPIKLIAVDHDGTEQTFLPTNGNLLTIEYNLEKGWNLIAVTGSNSDLSELKAAAVGNIWSWDGTKYVTDINPTPYSGLWVYSVEKKNVTISSLKSAPDYILNKGWTLAGPAYNVDAPEEVTVFSWSSKYNEIINKSNALIQGQGYWFFTEKEKEIQLSY